MKVRQICAIPLLTSERISPLNKPVGALPELDRSVTKRNASLNWPTAAPLIIILLALFFTLRQEASAQFSKVTVTIDSIGNKGCFDQWIFCRNPDMMVRVGLRRPDGNVVYCPDTTPIVNKNYAGPIVACSGRRVESPFDLVVSVFDVDEDALKNSPPAVNIQSEFKLSTDPNLRAAVLPWGGLISGSRSISGPDADIALSVAVVYDPPVFGNSTLNVSAPTFYPGFGERVSFTDTIVFGSAPPDPYPANAHVRFSVVPADPVGPSEEIGEAWIGSSLNFEWDGKLHGVIAPVGSYWVSAYLPQSGASARAKVEIASSASVFRVQNPALSRPWNPRAGAVQFPYVLSPGGTVTTRVEGPAPAGNACSAGPLLVAAPNQTTNVAAGSGTLSVAMKNASGVFLPSGNYCVHFDARKSDGSINGSVTQEIALENSPPLKLVVLMDPAVLAVLPSVQLPPDGSGIDRLVPSAPVFVEAHAYDDQRRDRPTGQIMVQVLPGAGIAPVPPAAITSATCTGTHVCRVQVGANTLALAAGGTFFAGNLVFQATASDLANPGNAEPRAASVAIPPRETQFSIPSGSNYAAISRPVTGSTTNGFFTVQKNTTIDVAFHAGTGLDLTIPAQASTFSDLIGRTLGLFFGGDAGVGDTSVMADSQNVAFWLSMKPAVVSVQGSSNPPNICQPTSVESVPFAEVQGIIHTVKCRDNSGIGKGSTFSAELGGAFPVANIIWHEFHHAAFELADEYCNSTPCDGGYFQTGDLPNVMSNATECSRHGAEPFLCTQIGTSGWWRAAPIPDVMIDNTRENLDDLRRAKLIFDQCKEGRF